MKSSSSFKLLQIENFRQCKETYLPHIYIFNFSNQTGPHFQQIVKDILYFLFTTFTFYFWSLFNGLVLAVHIKLLSTHKILKNYLKTKYLPERGKYRVVVVGPSEIVFMVGRCDNLHVGAGELFEHLLIIYSCGMLSCTSILQVSQIILKLRVHSSRGQAQTNCQILFTRTW